MNVRTESYTIPTAPLGPENPLPRFRDSPQNKDVRHDGTFLPEDEVLFGFDTGFKVLPDLIQDGYGRNKKNTKLKSIVLENEYLRARFLPDFGGRLVSLWDKESEREILYRNPVFQPANLAIRNAWFSGGIEWNIGVLGHSTHTCSPVFFASLKDDDNNDFLRMWEYQRTRGVFWQIDFHLPKGSRELGVYIRIINDTTNETPMYWWTNTAVPEDESCRVFSCAEDVIYVKPESVNSQGAFHGFGRGTLSDLDSLVGKDASYPLNFDYSSEYFFQTPEEEKHPWEAAGWGDGTLFFERSTSMLRYRKMFCWGNLDGGRHWCDHLSIPGSGDYVELQAGLAPTQVHGMKMPAGSSWEFSQFFGSGQMNPENYAGIWQEARNRVRTELDNRLPGREVERRHNQYALLKTRQPTEILHYGTGWGALEKRRRLHERRDCPKGILFPDDSLTKEQTPWLNLLETGRFSPEKDPQAVSWMCAPEWRPYLLGAAETDHSDPWPLIHLGMMAMESGELEQALEFWQKSVSCRSTAFAWRNIACVLSSWKEFRQSEEALKRAMDIADSNTISYLSEELMAIIVADGRYEDAWKHYETMPESVRNMEGHIVLAAEAAFHLGNEVFLESVFSREYTLVREGDRRMVDLWLRYRAAKSAAEPGADIKNESPPRNIDFRMV